MWVHCVFRCCGRMDKSLEVGRAAPGLLTWQVSGCVGDVGSLKERWDALEEGRRIVFGDWERLF